MNEALDNSIKFTVSQAPNNNYLGKSQQAPFCEEYPQLLNSHIDQLRIGSAISLEAIQDRGYETILGKKPLANLGFTKAQSITPGILIPLRSVDDGSVVGYQYKPDHPRVRNGKPIKYETPSGAANRVDCPLSCQRLLKDPNIPLWVTEGVKKADCLASLGECAIDISGVWSWRSKNELGGITISADFDYIALNGRQVYIAFDSDFITNPSVKLACRRLAENLSRKGANVFIVHLPQVGERKIGIDDFITSGHTLSEAKALARALEDDIELKEAEVEEGKVWQAYFWTEDKLYLEVLRLDGSYTFAYLKESGEVGFTNEVTVKDKVILPRPLPTKDGISKFIIGLPSQDIAYSRLLSPGELYSRLKAHFQKYCDLPEWDIELSIYYALFTWFYRKVNTLGYLRFLADTGKGKSRIQKAVGDVCFYPLYASGSSSFSGMARLQDKWRGTLIIDESDFTGEKEAQVTKYFILGFEAGKYYIMSDKIDPRKQEIFDPFCPKVMAMRSTFQNVALEGRLLSISPHETSNLNIPIILNSKYFQEMARLRNEVALFVLHHWSEIDGEKLLSFNDLKIEPRLKQLAMPLSVIFQIWPEGIQPFREYLLRRQQEIKRIRSQSWEGSLFNLVYSIAIGDLELQQEFASFYKPQSNQIGAVTPSMIAKQMKSTTKAVTQSLGSIGFEVKQKWITAYHKDEYGAITPKNKQVRAYTIPSQQVWDEIISRYHYSEDDKDTGIQVPDILKSSKYVCAKVSQVSQVSQKSADGQGLVTDVTDVTLENTEAPDGF